MDMISNLPSSIVETILCLLPIQEAARTSILSREWRYRWIKIPKIAFIENAFQVSTDEAELSVLEQSCVIPNERKEINKKCKFIHAINQVMTMHEGPIHEFTLSTETDDSWIEIEHIISQLDINNHLIHSSDDCTIINLFECLPVVEKLSILLAIVECFGEDGIPQELPNALVHMRYLYIGEICFIHKYGLPLLALLMRSSPKLEKLKLEILDDSWVEKCDRSDCVTLKDYSDIWLEHLKELEIENMIYRETQLDFVKFVLAKSPVLKKVRLFLQEEVGKDEQMQTLLDSPRASLEVQIIVEIAEGSHTGSRSVM
ncbi:F-box/FBD/LRR-repeat protein [Tanacetum coccineum]|uniref:F-box/FBD/LRR-repeat protein n=1 Tax=Tanacetum coccineum TaxID=301880 RepID=A0ABQ4XEI5_9ASTR